LCHAPSSATAVSRLLRSSYHACFFFFTASAPTEIYTLFLHDALPISTDSGADNVYDVTVQVSDGTNTDTQAIAVTVTNVNDNARSEEHTSELQSRGHLVCRLLLEKKKQRSRPQPSISAPNTSRLYPS